MDDVLNYKERLFSLLQILLKALQERIDKEKIQWIEMDYGSLMEVYCQFYLAFDLEYIIKEQFESRKPIVDQLR